MTASPAATLNCVLDARASLGECPVWSVVEQALYWVDINAPALHRFDPLTGRDAAMPMPAAIGSFGLRERGGYVVALRDGIWLAGADGRLEARIVAAPYDPASHRFNDGRCDAHGRFIVGSMNERRDGDSAQLYRLDPGGAFEPLFGHITISNGLAWSPDGRTMFHADTPARIVRRYRYDASTGTPSEPQVFAQFADDTRRPDGAAVDSLGNYWIAFYGGGTIAQISPAGVMLGTHPVPAMCPTMCAFGGPDLRTLYVTTARQKRDADELARLPGSGGLFAMQVDVPGLPEPRFAG